MSKTFKPYGLYIYIAVICLMRMGQCDELLCDDCDAKSRDDV